MKIETTTVTQTANETLGTKEKTLYYIIIKTNKTGDERQQKMVINVGYKTHNLVQQLLKAEANETELATEILKQKEEQTKNKK